MPSSDTNLYMDKTPSYMHNDNTNHLTAQPTNPVTGKSLYCNDLDDVVGSTSSPSGSTGSFSGSWVIPATSPARPAGVYMVCSGIEPSVLYQNFTLF